MGEVMERRPKGFLAQLGAADLAAGIARGEHTSEDVVHALLARIDEVEPKVQAWAFLDPAFALKQAREADRYRQSGRPIGPLHGVPVGVKDIVDVRGMPAENGTVLDAGRRPRQDAALIALLRQAGAIVLGKTVTT
jgi:Asp-tRNA(Asn)/Glu-tRNA(Gln) amidotransferase A subunit family amidase